MLTPEPEPIVVAVRAALRRSQVLKAIRLFGGHLEEDADLPDAFAIYVAHGQAAAMFHRYTSPDGKPARWTSDLETR